MKSKPKSILSLLCLLALTSFFTGCGETVISQGQKQTRNGLVYTPNSEIPFTGVVEDYYGNGQKKSVERYKDGKKHGIFSEWMVNGEKFRDFLYKDGELISEKWGDWIYEDGERIEDPRN